MAEQERKIIEGPPIYVESLMNAAEVRENCRRFPNTCIQKILRPLVDFAPGEMKWRWGMGGPLSTEEIALINKRLNELKKKAGI